MDAVSAIFLISVGESFEDYFINFYKLYMHLVKIIHRFLPKPLLVPFSGRDREDVVLDAVGEDTLERSITAMKRGGRLVTLPKPPREAIVSKAYTDRNVSVHGFSVEPNAAVLTNIRSLIENEQVEATVSGAWPLSGAAAAHRDSQRGCPGKTPPRCPSSMLPDGTANDPIQCSTDALRTPPNTFARRYPKNEFIERIFE